MLINNFVINVITYIGGSQFIYAANAEKADIIFSAIVLAFCVGLFFVLAYRKYFLQSEFSKKLFLLSIFVLPAIIFAKYTVFYFQKNYIADRFLFYALPSPKAEGLVWFLLVIAVAGAFLFFRERIEKLKTRHFLVVLWFTFVIFGMAAAGIREGAKSVYEPFTRVKWEYSGDVQLVKSVRTFLESYTKITSQLSLHGQTHPPGYTIFLYLLSKIFGYNLIVLSLWVGAFGGLTIVPLYFFAKHFLDDLSAKRGLQIFIFLPSVVMFSFTSMEAVLLFFSWLALVTTLYGWTRSYALSFLGGIFTGLCFMFNFLFALTFPIYIFIFLRAWLIENKKYKLVSRVTLSFFGFILFFVMLYLFAGYSIIENFFVARAANQEIVHSNFESLSIYLIYFFMNISAFIFYLGIPNLSLWFTGQTDFNKFSVYVLGPIMVLLFLVIGIFQGEVERIWLFLTPLFVVTLAHFFKKINAQDFSALLFCLVWQIIIIQILFYTYW